MYIYIYVCQQSGSLIAKYYPTKHDIQQLLSSQLQNIDPAKQGLED